MIKPDYLNGWTYHPEFTTADTSSLESTIHINDSTEAIADAIDRRINDLHRRYANDSTEAIADAIDRRIHHIYNEREANMVGIKFNDLEKDLRDYGITLSTIRSSSGNSAYEIEGYFTPSVYIARTAREKLTLVHPVGPKPIPKKVIFSGPATTILWKDGTKTTVKCSSEDVWDDDVGIAMCYLKKMLGNKGNFNNIFREAMKVAEVQHKKEELVSSTAIEGESYYSSALDNMKRNIDEINDFMKDAAEALDKVSGGKK